MHADPQENSSPLPLGRGWSLCCCCSIRPSFADMSFFFTFLFYDVLFYCVWQGPAAPATDLETFFEGFGVREETIAKIKELGFTGKTFMSNLDELPLLFESIKQHCHLTVGEEWGIKGAAKKWQKGLHLLPWPKLFFLGWSRPFKAP